MADLTLVAKIKRDLLSLADLDINDGVNYAIAGPAAWGGAVRWKREQIDSPDIHGEVTIHRKMTNGTDPLTIYAKGSTHTSLDTAMATLKAAMFQHRFVLQIGVNGQDHQWDCEAADLEGLTWDTAHVYNRIVAMTFSIPHYPIPLVGAL